MYEFDINKEQKVIDRLLKGPAVIRYRTMLDLLQRSESDPEVVRARKASRDSREIGALLNNRGQEGKLSRPEWWGSGPKSYKGLRLQPWVLKVLSEGGCSRGDDEVRKAAHVCLEMQNPDGSFGILTGLDRVRFTAEITYALSQVGYGGTGDLRNAMRMLMAWLKENESVRFDARTGGPGRMLLEALVPFEPFTFSPLAQRILKMLFVGRKSVLTAAVTPERVRMGGYDGLLTWSELGFAIGWPRSWEAPYQVMAVLAACRNRDGAWGQGGTDLAETLRALRLWRDLFETYGPAPKGFRFESAEAVGTGTPTRKKTKAVKTTDTPASGELSTRRRHMRAFKRAGLEELVGAVVGLLSELGYQPDWKPMYEVVFKTRNSPCTFKLSIETGAGKSQHALVLSATGTSPNVNVKHWLRQLGLDRAPGKPRLQVSRSGPDKAAQVRLILDDSQRKALPRLKVFLTQLKSVAASTPTNRGSESRGSGRRSRRRRPRGRKR